MNKTISAAVYVSKYGGESVSEVRDWIETHDDYTRVSEPVDVTFTLLPRENVLKLRLACLDREIQSVRANAAKKVEGLEADKQRLMLITDESDEKGESHGN